MTEKRFEMMMGATVIVIVVLMAMSIIISDRYRSYIPFGSAMITYGVGVMTTSCWFPKLVKKVVGKNIKSLGKPPIFLGLTIIFVGLMVLCGGGGF